VLEPDVTITDFILAIQCFCFAALIYRRSTNVPWLLLFGSLSIASLAGGITHGFLSDEQSSSYAILWRAALIAIGVVALAGWQIGAGFLHNKKVARWIKQLAAVQFFLFALTTLFYSQRFLLAALNYLPAALFLFVVFARSYLKTSERAPFLGAAGIFLTLTGSFIQIAKIPLHPQYFNHNAFYHAIQFSAICLLFVTARWDIARRGYERT
jgi:uncharacterized protein DUF6962